MLLIVSVSTNKIQNTESNTYHNSRRLTA